MEVVKFLLTFLAWFGTILLMDYIWLGYVVKKFTIAEFGELIVLDDKGSIKINLAAGFFAWAVIVMIVYIFVLKSWYGSTLGSAAIYGGILGGLTYAMYDFTNLTFLKNYSFQFSVVDVCWGIFLCGMISVVMFGVDKYLTKVL